MNWSHQLNGHNPTAHDSVTVENLWASRENEDKDAAMFIIKARRHATRPRRHGPILFKACFSFISPEIMQMHHRILIKSGCIRKLGGWQVRRHLVIAKQCDNRNCRTEMNCRGRSMYMGIWDGDLYLLIRSLDFSEMSPLFGTV